MRNMWFMGAAFAAGIAASSWFLTAPASTAATDTIISQLSVENVSSILTEWGATDIGKAETTSQKFTSTTGEVTLTTQAFTFKHSGVLYQARIYCNQTTGNCLGLRVSIAFEDTGVPLPVLDSFNANYRAGKAFKATGVYVSDRYIIVDNGVARSNIAVQLAVLEGVTANLLAHIKEKGTIASAPTTGGTTPISFNPHTQAITTAFHVAAAEDAKTMPINRIR